MILHHAHLCAVAGGVDAFLIGTEMRGLTTIRSSASAYLSLTTRADSDCSPAFLATVFHDVWMPCFIRLITEEAETLTDHESALRSRFEPLVRLIFTEDCAARPRRNAKK